MSTLVLLRHGESAWNARDLFTGWVDVALTAAGEEQARHSGALLARTGLLPTVAHTSVLSRAVRSGDLALAAAGRSDVPVRRSWRLNERHYGALQGMDRRAARLRYGDEQFRQWRRSYHARPPAGEPVDDPRYADVPPALLPRTESLLDVRARLLPYWTEVIAPDLTAGHTVLVVAHGNSLRALVSHLDDLSAEEVLRLDVPTGMPLHYDLGADLTPVVRGGQYLEPAAAAVAAAAVAAQGS